MNNSLRFLIQMAQSGLIKSTVSGGAPPPGNNPPVWDSQPAPTFTQGTASNYSLVDLVSDPDLDSIDVTLNTGTAALPSGVTYNTTLDRLEYDGVGATTGTTGHIATADDGTDTTDSISFGINISNWPAYGAHVQTMYNVSNYPLNYQQDPYREWNSKKDLIVAQHRYPSASQIAAEVADTAWMRAENSNIKLQQYTFKSAAQPNPSSAKYLSVEAMEENGMNSSNPEASWRHFDSQGRGILEWWSNSGDVNGYYAINTNYGDSNMPAGSSDANFSTAFWNKLKQKNNDNWVWDGYFWDSTDYKDSKPGYVLASDGTTLTNPNYTPWTSSPNTSTDSQKFRQGIAYDIAKMREIGPSTLFASGNGGRDGDAVNEPLSQNDWAGLWDLRISENLQTKLGLITSANNWEIQYANPDSRVDIAIRAHLITEGMVDLTSSNRLGKGMVVMDFVMNWSTSAAAIPATIAAVPSAHYEAARFVCGLSALHDSFIAGPCLTRGTYPFPYMDEYVYDPGNPVGGTPSIGSIDAEDTSFPFTMRAQDQAAEPGAGNYGFMWQEFDNVLWVVNLNEPTGNGAAWPQATEDTVTLPDPDVGGGEVWRFADATYTNGSRTTGATACESQDTSINDGSLTGATIDMPRWTARMLVRSAS